MHENGVVTRKLTVLSAAMLLRYSLHEEAAARAIESAVEQALKAGWRTADLYKDGFKKADTKTMTQVIISYL